MLASSIWTPAVLVSGRRNDQQELGAQLKAVDQVPGSQFAVTRIAEQALDPAPRSERGGRGYSRRPATPSSSIPPVDPREHSASASAPSGST
jgi:hypothetical protein